MCETANWQVICVEKVPNMANFKMATIKILKLTEIHKLSYLGYTSTQKDYFSGQKYILVAWLAKESDKLVT